MFGKYKTLLMVAILIVIFSSGLTYSILEHIFELEELSLFSSVIVAGVEIAGLIAIWYQLKKQKDVEVANFLLEFEKSFEEHKPIYQKIEQSRESEVFTTDDISGIVRYLTFYESLFYFVRKRVLSIDMVDDLFGYRFFLAMHCEFIQQHNLIPYRSYYANIFQLYEEWMAYREKRGLSVPRSFNRIFPGQLSNGADPVVLRRGSIIFKNETGSHHQNDTDHLPYEIRVIGEESLDALMDLQDIIMDSIEQKDLFQITTREEYRVRLHEKGRTLGAFADGRMIAYFGMYFPHQDENEHLGFDTGMNSEQRSRTAYFESIGVHPDYRGHGLQQKMQEDAYELCQSLGYTHLMSTVAPDNFYSLRNLLGFRFVIRKRTIKYGGKHRFILHRDMNAAPLNERSGTIELVSSTDASRQKELSDSGALGFKVSNMNNGVFTIHYLKPSKGK